MGGLFDDIPEEHLNASELALHVEEEYGGVDDVRIYNPDHIAVVSRVGGYLRTMPETLLAFLHGQGFTVTSQMLDHDDTDYGDSPEDTPVRLDVKFVTEFKRGEVLDEHLSDVAHDPDLQYPHEPRRADVTMRPMED
jgi:hypothetical protein